MPESTATEVYRAARDQLLGLTGDGGPADHARAVAEFRWPQFAGPFLQSGEVKPTAIVPAPFSFAPLPHWERGWG